MQATLEERTEHTPQLPGDARGQVIGFVPQVRPSSWGLIVETNHVWLISLIVGIVCYYIRPHFLLFSLDPKGDFLTKVVDVAAVLTAYALTALTVLPALNDRTAVQRLRKSGQYGTFCNYVAAALYSNAWLTIFGLGVKLGFDHISAHTRVIAPMLSDFWWASCCFALLSLFRASRLLLKLVTSN